MPKTAAQRILEYDISEYTPSDGMFDSHKRTVSHPNAQCHGIFGTQ